MIVEVSLMDFPKTKEGWDGRRSQGPLDGMEAAVFQNMFPIALPRNDSRIRTNRTVKRKSGTRRWHPPATDNISMKSRLQADAAMFARRCI